MSLNDALLILILIITVFFFHFETEIKLETNKKEKYLKNVQPSLINELWINFIIINDDYDYDAQ